MLKDISLALPSSVASFFVLCGGYWAVWIIYARYWHPLSKYPGPFLASISRLWLAVQVAGGGTEKNQRELHDQLGPIIRIAPNEVAIADPVAVKTIYAVNSGYEKTDFYLPWRPTWSKYPDAFTCLDERVHAKRRKIVNSLYSMSSIVQAEESIDVCIDLFMTRLNEFVDSGQEIDLSKWVQWFAFDVIGQLFFSRMFGFMRDRGDHRDYIKSLDTLLPALATASILPSYLRSIFLLGGAVMPGFFKALSCIKDIENAAESCIAERQDALETEPNTEKKDILEGLMGIVREKGEKVDFGMTEVKVEVYVALFAGSDTTAAAISSIFYHLVRHRSAYRNLKDEIHQARQDGKLSTPIARYNEAAALPYLDACCKEGMRMHPSVGLTLPRTVPAGGRSIAGEWFAEGTRVGVNAAVLHRNKAIFGDDADDFNPNRWFRDHDGSMNRHMFQFGGGSRTCIGKNISLCEMYKLIPEILTRFDLEHTGRDWETHNFWFNKPTNVSMRLERCEETRV